MASSPENSPSQDSPASPPASPPPSEDNSSSGSSSSPPTPDNSNSYNNNNSSSSSDSSPSPPSNNSPDQGQGSPPSPPSDSGSSSPTPPISGGNKNNGGSSNTPAAPKTSNNNNDNNSKSPPSSNGGSSNDNDSSPATNSGSPPDDSSSGASGNQKVIVGVAVGAALLLVVLILFLTACCRRKKKKQKQQQANQYYNYGGPKADQQYYMGQQQGPYPEGMRPPMHQSGMGGSPATGWGVQPYMSGGSGEMSSNFSGAHLAPMPPPSPVFALGFNKSTFTYEELAAATNGFSDANLLGQGGFGYVHKGVLPNGKVVAVKSLKSGSGQGEREFQAEVEIISRVHHRHLVSLVGYCIAGGQRMLVYEFVPNNTLEYHLHGKHHAVMDFQTRLRIALGSAKGLAYLHEDCHPKIIHRDIKAANILIENDFEAKVADFGLAKLSSDNYTHVSTRVMGTFGYLAPEYASSGKLTEKSDVFSFGVMLLELVTGKQPVDHTNAMDEGLVDWARPLLNQCLEEGNFDAVADPMLERNYNPQEMARLIGCAAAAIRHSAKKRPRMSQIVRALEGESSLDDLNEGVKPGQSTIFGTTGASSDYSKSSYNADMQRFRQLALASGEVNSSDYSSNDSRDMTPKNM